MSKLEQYKKNAKKGHSQDEVDSWVSGFDAAIALDLPIKFAIWLRHDCIVSSDEGILPDCMEEPINEVEAYKYWLNNIYEP